MASRDPELIAQGKGLGPLGVGRSGYVVVGVHCLRGSPLHVVGRHQMFSQLWWGEESLRVWITGPRKASVLGP